MTVEELIKVLKTLDPQKEVFIWEGKWELFDSLSECDITPLEEGVFFKT